MTRFYKDMEEIIGAVLLAAMCLVAVAKVGSRYVLASPFSWSEELATILFSWVVFVGASLALKKNEHFSMDVLVELLPRAPKRLIQTIGLGLVAIFCLLIVFYGIKLTVLNWQVKTAVLEISRAWLYLAVPFGGALMLLRTIETFVRLWRSDDGTLACQDGKGAE